MLGATICVSAYPGAVVAVFSSTDGTFSSVIVSNDAVWSSSVRTVQAERSGGNLRLRVPGAVVYELEGEQVKQRSISGDVVTLDAKSGRAVDCPE